MGRRALYFAVVTGVVVLAAGLRLRSALSPAPTLDGRRAVTEEPGDRVRDPWVATDEVNRGPKRIISLAPSITEIVCALGMRDRLVGRTQYCQYPPEVESVSIVGALTDANYEKIKSLQPDLVLVTENSFEVIRTLDAIGVRHETIVHESLNDVYTAIGRVGEICDRPHTAQALIGALWTDIDRLKRAAAEREKAAARQGHAHGAIRVLLVLNMRVPPQALFAASGSTFLGELLALTGYGNAEADATWTYSEVPLERLVQLNPDIIVDFGPPRTPEQDEEMYASWSKLPGLKAVEHRRILSMGGGLSAGPRIALELRRLILLLAQCDF